MDLNLFWHSIRASAGNSFLWETAGPNIFRGEYHDSFNMDLMCKDIQLCFDMAKSAKVRYQNSTQYHHFSRYVVELCLFKKFQKFTCNLFHCS